MGMDTSSPLTVLCWLAIAILVSGLSRQRGATFNIRRSIFEDPSGFPHAGDKRPG